MVATSAPVSRRGADTPMNTSAPAEPLDERAREPGRVGVRRDPRLERVEALATGVHRAAGVEGDDVPGALRQQQPDDRLPRGAGARDEDPDVGQRLPDDAQRVRQGGEHDDRGPVLVVVEDGDVEHLPQPRLDLEASRRGDVLEVDPPVDRRQGARDRDDLVRVLRVQADRPGVDAREPLEQRGLALHHRQRSGRSDVAEAQHRGPVGQDGDRVALDRQAAGVLGVAGDRLADPGDAGRVGAGQVVTVAQLHLRGDLELAAEVHEEGPVAHLPDDEPVELRDRLGDALDVLGVRGVAADVHDEEGRVDSATSRAVTTPPALPMAVVRSPIMPAGAGASTRTVIE